MLSRSAVLLLLCTLVLVRSDIHRGPKNIVRSIFSGGTLQNEEVHLDESGGNKTTREEENSASEQRNSTLRESNTGGLQDRKEVLPSVQVDLSPQSLHEALQDQNCQLRERLAKLEERLQMKDSSAAEVKPRDLVRAVTHTIREQLNKSEAGDNTNTVDTLRSVTSNLTDTVHREAEDLKQWAMRTSAAAWANTPKVIGVSYGWMAEAVYNLWLIGSWVTSLVIFLFACWLCGYSCLCLTTPKNVISDITGKPSYKDRPFASNKGWRRYSGGSSGY